MARRLPCGTAMLAVLFAMVLSQAPGITLEDALTRSAATSPELRAAQARAAAAELEESVFTAQWLPRVGLMAQAVLSTTNNSTATLVGASTVDLPRIGATPVKAAANWAPAPSTGVAVGVRQQLFDFGRGEMELDAARARTSVERVRLALSGVELKIAVIQAWHAVKAGHAVLTASEEAVTRARTHRDFIRAGVSANLRAPVEAARAEVELQRMEVVRLRSEAQLELAQRQLGAITGVDGALDATGNAPAPRALPQLEAYLAEAAENGRLREVKARAQAQHAQAEATSALGRPLLWATAAVSGRAGGATPSSGPVPFADGWLPVVPNWDLGVIFTWQALDPVQLARANEARARARVADADVNAARTSERQAATVAWLEADANSRALPALELAVESALASQQQAESRFRLGLASLIELTDAERQRTEAELQLALGRLSAARAAAALERFRPSENP